MRLNGNAELIRTISLPLTATIRQAMQAIDRGAMGTALLVDEKTGQFNGLVTDGDLRRALLKGYGLKSPVADVPRPPSKTANIGMSSAEITGLFSSPVRVLPILDDAGKVADLAIFDKRIRLPVAEPSLGDRELAYVTECVLTGWVSSAGKFVNRFEEMVAAACQAKYAIATSSGTTALHLALTALDIGPGDEVIVPTLTFIATANAVTYTGATPVFADSEPKTWNLSPKSFEKAITAKTKAVIPVHLYGHPADMDSILEIARINSLAVIEDAAEAQGACHKDRPVGGLGDLGIFSFYGNKTITTGEGGMIVTNRDDLVKKIRVLRDHGMSSERRYWHPVLGYNYRMTNLQAALGVAQMERIESIINTKQIVAQSYEQGLKNIPGIQLPPEASWATNIFWLYSILIDDTKFGMNRDQLAAYLKKQDIDTRPLFPPIHQQPIYKETSTFPVAQELSKKGLSLPSSTNLSSDEIQRTISTIESAYKLAHSDNKKLT